jgi:hypothetical protein
VVEVGVELLLLEDFHQEELVVVEMVVDQVLQQLQLLIQVVEEVGVIMDHLIMVVPADRESLY